MLFWDGTYTDYKYKLINHLNTQIIISSLTDKKPESSHIEFNADKFRFWRSLNFTNIFIYLFFFSVIWKGDVLPKIQAFHFQPWKSTAIVSVIYPEGKSEEKLGIYIFGYLSNCIYIEGLFSNRHCQFRTFAMVFKIEIL